MHLLKFTTVLFVLLIWLIACENEQAKSTNPHQYTIAGTWKLVSRIDKTANDSTINEPTLGSDPIALLMYDSAGNMSVQIMKRNRTDSVPVKLQQSVGNNSAAFNGYDAYFGTYAADTSSGEIIHRVTGAINPDDVGKELKRRYVLSGDTLRLSFSTTNGVQVTRTLTWSRVKSK